MIPEPSTLAIGIFLAIVGLTLGLSFYLGAQARSAKGYFAAGGGIHWFVNGVAFAGDYLSAASFLGICGMIAFYGYDGFLYSIGFLAGWIVALLVVAEPLKRLGKYTLADALDHRFHSKGIKLAVAVSTLVASLFYLIPQMVGAGALVKPLLGLEHEYGVVLVGAIVTIIVATAGMVSTTYVQFLKGALLVVFTFIMTVMVLMRGLNVTTDPMAMEKQTVVVKEGQTFVNGLPQGKKEDEGDYRTIGHVKSLPSGSEKTGPLGPITFLKTFRDSEIIVWKKSPDPNDKSTTHYVPAVKRGSELLTPGNHPMFAGIKSSGQWKDSLNFISLMLALFCGTASLPHILIRYYTVKDQASARKSTVIGIITIGLFYILTLYIGLGAMTSGALDVTNNNMAAPLLARSFGEWLFAIISAIAFTTVLGTVSGLIIAAAGAVVHDLAGSVLAIEMNDHGKVRLAKIASVVVGVIAIVLGIVFENMNVGFLVGWAFSIAASANLPALVMMLFWKRTTKEGVIAAVTVGTFSALAWVLLSKEAMVDVYGVSAANSPVPFSQPGIVTIPLSFFVLVIVSLMTTPPDSIKPIKG